MAAASFEADDWSCPICMDLLHKPAANTCGHVFCFWCLHQAMSPYTPSKCPLCRSPFANLPSVCLVVHNFLLTAFPKEYRQRLEEVAADERHKKVSSPEIPATAPHYRRRQEPVEVTSGPFHEQEFACSNPSCGKLLHNPVVLTCGHTVCGNTCQPKACMEADGSSRSAHCQTCKQIVQRGSLVCNKLSELLHNLFPEAQRRRAEEVATACTAAHPSQASAGSAQRDTCMPASSPTSSYASAEDGDQQAAMQDWVVVPDTARTSGTAGDTARTSGTAGDLGAASAAVADSAGQLAAQGGTSTGQVEQRQGASNGPNVGTQSLGAANDFLIQSSTQGIPVQSSRRTRGLQALARLTRDADKTFVHHGVGCDSCGVYPIVGRRFKCLDCQERMGTDLCGLCMDRDMHVTGRFNQQHKPDHEMLLMKPQINSLHIIQAMNPDLSMDQLMYLLELSTEVDDDSDGDDGGDPSETPTEGQASTALAVSASLEPAEAAATQHAQRDSSSGGADATRLPGGADDDHEFGSFTSYVNRRRQQQPDSHGSATAPAQEAQPAAVGSAGTAGTADGASSSPGLDDEALQEFTMRHRSGPRPTTSPMQTSSPQGPQPME